MVSACVCVLLLVSCLFFLLLLDVEAQDEEKKSWVLKEIILMNKIFYARKNNEMRFFTEYTRWKIVIELFLFLS
jgi:hypothetical protein